MLVIVQIWDAQKQELAGRVGVTSRRIASKVAEVLHDGKTAKIKPIFGYRICGFTQEVSTGERNVSGSACPRGQRRSTG